MNTKNKVYYCFGKLEDEFVLLVTDSKEFDEEHCQSDYTPDGVEEELERLGYRTGEEMEGVIGFHQNIDTNKLKKDLETSSLFEYNFEFEKFLKSCDGIITVGIDSKREIADD
jgi:hypothetical protein